MTASNATGQVYAGGLVGAARREVYDTVTQLLTSQLSAAPDPV